MGIRVQVCGVHVHLLVMFLLPLFLFLLVLKRRSLVRSPARPIFFPRIDDSHCDRIYSFLTAVRCFDNGYVGKQQVACKVYCAEYWLKELQESKDRCTGRRDITEILSKTALNTIQSINYACSFSAFVSSVSVCIFFFFVCVYYHLCLFLFFF